MTLLLKSPYLAKPISVDPAGTILDACATNAQAFLFSEGSTALAA